MAGLFYKYIVKTNLFIAICSCAFYLSGSILLRNKDGYPSENLLGVIVLSTFLIYTISKKTLSPPLLFPIKITIYSGKIILTTLAIFILARNLSSGELVVLAFLGMVSVLYNAVSLKNFYLVPLRGIPLLKVLLISFVWAGVGVVLPNVESTNTGTGHFFLLLFSQFFFIISITLPFDIRDFYKDLNSRLVTIPSVIGIRNTRYVAIIALVLHVAGMRLVNHSIWILYLPFSILVFFLIFHSKASRPDFYYTVLIDGLIILQFLILYFQSVLFSAMI